MPLLPDLEPAALLQRRLERTAEVIVETGLWEARRKDSLWSAAQQWRLTRTGLVFARVSMFRTALLERLKPILQLLWIVRRTTPPMVLPPTALLKMLLL